MPEAGVWNLPLFNLANERQNVADTKFKETQATAAKIDLAVKSVDWISGLPPEHQPQAYESFRQHAQKEGYGQYVPPVNDPAELAETLQKLKFAGATMLQRLQMAKTQQDMEIAPQKLEIERMNANKLTPASMAMTAMGEGPEAEKAMGALKLLPQEADSAARLSETARHNTETERHDREMEGINKGKKDDKPDTANEDKQKRIDIAKRKELKQPVSDEDEAWAKAYDKVSTNVAVTGAQARTEGFGAIRIQNYYDNQTGKEVTMTANEFGEKGKTEPGRYNLTTPSATDKNVQKVAYVADLRNRMGSVWTDLDKMPEWTEAQKVELVNAMKERDPSSAISQLMGSAFGSTLSDEQTDYLIHVRQLNENVLGMRNLTQGSPAIERVVEAIEKTVPGMLTPNKKFAYKQLNALSEQLQDLEKGFAKVPVPGTGKTESTGGKSVDGQIEGHRYRESSSGRTYVWTNGQKVYE